MLNQIYNAVRIPPWQGGDSASGTTPWVGKTPSRYTTPSVGGDPGRVDRQADYSRTWAAALPTLVGAWRRGVLNTVPMMSSRRVLTTMAQAFELVTGVQ